jgi:uncharacterized protein YjiS (DUF1127 family)
MTDLSTAFHWTSRTAAEPSRIRGLFGALLREIRIRRALRDVSTLDDAMLCDIGLSRGGIEDSVRHGRHLD